MLLLGVTGTLLMLAGCRASGAAGPIPSAAATCSAVRAAFATSVPMAPHATLTIPSETHLSYSRSTLGPLPPQLVYHSGAAARFTWCALPDRLLVTAQPVPETLTAGFVGPFATRAAAQTDQLPPSPPPPGTRGPLPHGFPPPGPLAASTIPIHTTTWNGADATASLTLPTTLAPGYYVYFMLDAVSLPACMALTSGSCRGNGGESGIVQITRT